MREFRLWGSVRGAASNRCPYRDRVGGVECFRQVREASTARDVRLNLHRQRMGDLAR